MNDINLKITHQPGEDLVIRHGEASPVHLPVFIANHNLTLESVTDFIDSYKGETGRDLLTVNTRDRTISYMSDVDDPFHHRVTGRLLLLRELLEWPIYIPGVNEPKKLRLDELHRFIKPRRRHFNDGEVYLKLLAALRDFRNTRTVQTQVKDDRRGNKAASSEQAVEIEFEENFVLKLPLFEGDDAPASFVVDVFLDVTDAGTLFAMESLDLAELIADRAKEYVDMAVAAIKKLPREGGRKITVVYEQ